MTRRAPTIACIGPKGGVGKTTIGLHLAAGLGSRKAPAVLADVDPQGAASAWILGETPAPFTLAQDLAARRPMRTIPAPSVGALLLAPGDLDLAELDSDIPAAREALPRLLQAPPGVTAVVLDCPPSWGGLLAGALAAADWALIVCDARPLGLAGLERALELVDRMRELGARVRLLGIVANRVSRTRASRETAERIKERYRLALPPVREAAAMAELPLRGVTIWEAAPDHPVRGDVDALVRAVARRIGG